MATEQLSISEDIRAQIEAEVREKIKEEQKAKRKKKPTNKEPKRIPTWDEVWEVATWKRTYDHLVKDERYDSWLDQLEKSNKLYVDFETGTDIAVKPYEIVEQVAIEKNWKNFKSIWNNILIEVTGHDKDGKNKDNKGFALDPKKSFIRLMQIGDNKDTFIFDRFKCTKEQLERIGRLWRDRLCIGHNILFECRFICETWGVNALPFHVYDTMLVEKIIMCSELSYLGVVRFDLGSVAERRAGIHIEKGYGGSDWGNPELSEEQMNYAAEDVDIMRPIVKAQLPKLKNLGNSFVRIERDVENDLKFLNPLRKLHVIAAIECDVVPCFARMMHIGIPINKDALIEESKRRDEEFEKVCDECGFNINSNPQCLDILVNQEHLNIESTSADALAPYADSNALVKKILDGRSVDTINGLLKGFLEASERYGDNRVHPHFTTYQAYSGRTACKDPNVQQVPRELKPIWMMPPKGRTIVNLDYPAIELRLAAGYINEKTMIDAFKHGKDLHKITAAAVNNIPIDQVTKDQRKKAKAVNFGYVYGCSAKRFKQTAMTKFGIDYSLEEANQIRTDFFKGYPDLDRHVRRMFKLFPYGQKDMRAIVKTFLGRKMMVDGSGNALNFPIQGSGADAAKIAIIYFYYKLRTYKDGKYSHGQVEPISFVHDEIFVESDVNCMKFTTKLLKKSLEIPMNYLLGDWFSVKVEPELGDFKGESWKEKYTEEELQKFIDEIGEYCYTINGKVPAIKPE